MILLIVILMGYFLGNLALSRALGDFVFKKNEEKSAKEQIVTGKNPASV